MKKCILGLAVVLFTTSLLAQDETPRAEVFGGYSYLHVDSGQVSFSQNGWNAQGSFNFNRWLGVTADFGGYYGYPGQGLSAHQYSYLFGPTLTYRKQYVAPFFHALFGGAHFGGTENGTTVTYDSFALAIGGGVDIPIKPHFGIRPAQLDWMRTNFIDTQTQNDIRFSTGILFQFGK